MLSHFLAHRRPLCKQTPRVTAALALLTSVGPFFLSTAAPSAPNAGFELRDGDRVVFIGDTLIEREQAYGYVEERLTVQFPERNVTFRNLGWSADSPAGESRASFDFDKPGKGFQKLREQIAAAQPTVAIIGYGMANSFSGQAGLPAFREEMNRLLDAIAEVSTNHNVRFILLSPIRHEALAPPLPDPAKHNVQLQLYVNAVRETAAKRGALFVSLFELKHGRNRALTDNGIHLSAYGYQQAADAVAKGLGWHNRIALDSARAELLRQAIIKKNELYFYRSRPQNETYLFGFRKHEQGQNAKEVPEFDPLIEQEEARIAELRRAAPSERSKSFDPHEFHSVFSVENRALNPSLGSVVPTHELQDTNQVPTFDIAPGFEVNLFAETPLLAKPIQMNFDPQGRLWVASSEVYPQIQPGQEANDKIIVLEDTNHDGYAETSRVFADGLLIPTAVIPCDGGAYVGQSTELLHFADTDGDGRADRKRIVLSGFGTEDTHHMVHTLRWGPDGQLYFNQSIYIHSYFETPHGIERLNSGGVWHLRTATQQLGVFLRGFCNPWGHAFDDFGQSFVTDGAGYQGISFGIPDATYFTYAIMRRELKSISPGNYPKFCGLELIRSTQFPPDWQGSAITCDFRAHRVVRFGIEEQGAGFAAHEICDLIRSTNVSFRPIDVKLGPDGAVYIADWSNPIIQHGEVDFRDPRRDHEHGRIWRVTAKGRSLAARPSLVNASNRTLLDELLSANGFNQQQARRVLAERGLKIEKELQQWTRAHQADTALLEALWMYQGIDVVEPSLLRKVLAAQDGRIRAAGVRVASYWYDRLPGAVALVAAAINDTNPRVRLEAVRALAGIPGERSAALVLSALEKEMDPFLDYGVWLSINDLADSWVAAVKSGAWKPDEHENQFQFALKAIEPARAGEVIAEAMRNREIPRDGHGPWITLIGKAGNEALLSRLFEQVLKPEFDQKASEQALKALNTAAGERSLKPSGDLARIKQLLPRKASVSSDELPQRIEAVRLVGNWKMEQFVPELIGVAESSEAADLRQAAFDSLRQIGGNKTISALEPLTAGTAALPVRKQAVVALASLSMDRAIRPATEILLGTTNENEAVDVWRSLLNIKNSGATLARELPKTNLPPAMAKAGLRAAREGGRNEPDLVWALTRGANLDEESQTLSATEIQELAAAALKDGDPARGERIFRRKELSCLTCHAIGGAGGKVGPDLTSIGASAQPDYLVESVLYPNRKVKEGYHTVIVETKDGLEHSGVVASENQEQLVLRDATGKETTVLKKDLENRLTAGSLMPSGLVDVLSARERLDFYRFLAELGKLGPFDASKGNVARAWKLCVQTLDLAQFGDERVLKTELTDDKWTPAETLVDGRLLKETLSAAVKTQKSRDPQAVFAATRFQVAKTGTISLKLAGASGAPAWLDGQPLKDCADLRTELTGGMHTFIVKLDSNKLPQNIRLESGEGTFVGL